MPERDLNYFFDPKSLARALEDDAGIDLNFLDVYQQLLSGIMYSEKGGLFIQDLVRKASNYVASPGNKRENIEYLRSIFSLCSNAEPGEVKDLFTPKIPNDFLFKNNQEVAGDGNNPKKSNCTIGAIQIFPSTFGFDSRGSDKLGIFLNGISNLHWSRCVPFFNIKVFSRNSQIASMSLDNFLNDKERGADNQNIGMEIFTSPQTLVSPDLEYYEPADSPESLGSTPIIDKFRPFLSIGGISFNVATAHTMESYKTGKINFILHDRSRLQQVAPLVKPDLYASTELLIEYGWSYPGDNTEISAYINSLRKTEKYGLVNSSFTFDENGQVRIETKLAMKGVVELTTSNVLMGKTSAGILLSMETIQEAILTIWNKKYGKKDSTVKDLFGKTIVQAGSSLDGANRLGEEELKKIKAALAKDSVAGKELSAQLSKLVTKKKELKDAETKSLEQKIKILKSPEDPFAAPFPMLDSLSGAPAYTLKIKSPGMVNEDFGNYKNYASLGKVLMTFIGLPLASLEKFDEIQFIFYCFNSKAGYVRNHNISQFPIVIDHLETAYEDLYESASKVSLRQFTALLNSSFMEQDHTPGYGLSIGDESLYEYKTNVKREDKTGVVWELKKTYAESSDKLESQREKLLRSAYPAGADIEFVRPIIRIVPESVPAIDSDNNISPEKTILRLHIYDEAASKSTPLVKLIKSVTDNSLSSIKIANESEDISTEKLKTCENQCIPAFHGRLQASQLHAATNSGILHQVSPDYLSVKPGISRLKEFLRQHSVSCIVGSHNSSILKANLSTMNDPGLASILIQRAYKSDPNNPSGLIDDGFPKVIQPVQLTVEMMGCPIFDYGEEVFFDFNTNTSIDNFYACVGVDHQISPGNFKSTAKFAYRGGFESFKPAAQQIKDDQEMINSSEKGSGTSRTPDANAVFGGGGPRPRPVSMEEVDLSVPEAHPVMTE